MSAFKRSLQVKIAFAISAVCALFLLPMTSVHAGCSLDIDADGEINATTDGLLVTRYMLGIRGTALTAGALGAAAARIAPADVAAYIAAPCVQAAAQAACSLDIDGNGATSAATDGLLLMRYLVGLRGASLTAGALGAGATRTAPADIATYIATPCAQLGWVGSGTGRLNDTGAVIGGDAATGNNPGCTGTTIAQQDCSRGRDATTALNSNADGKAGFQFSKISNSGAVLPATAALGADANDWACTYDHVTGLTWEVKTTGGLRSSAHNYSWYSSDASNNGGGLGSANTGLSCFDTVNCDTEKFTKVVNLAGLCGHNDWRLPHAKELESIVDMGTADPAIDSNYFPNTRSAFYWSGSPRSVDNVWWVGFKLGNTNSLGSKTFNAAIRLVRTGR